MTAGDRIGMTPEQVDAACEAWFKGTPIEPWDTLSDNTKRIWRDNMLRALTAADALAWRPIAEYQPDGKLADLWVRYWDEPARETDCMWDSFYGHWKDRRGQRITPPITHFRPLPEPPHE